MTQYIQNSLPHFDEEYAKAMQQDIPEDATCVHLRRQFSRWRRYANFSKDPEFLRRCHRSQWKLIRFLENHRF